MRWLVLHGLGRSAAEWTACAHALDPRAIVPDLPEMRRTDAAPDAGVVISSALAALGTAHVASAAWLGHSGGAHVALEAAVAYPAHITHLVLVAAVPSARLLARVRCPVLVVLGGAQGLHVEPSANVRVAVLDGVGHDPHLEAPDLLVDAIRRL